MIRKIIKKLLHQLRLSLGIIEMKADLSVMKSVIIEEFISRELRENNRYKNKKRLNQYEMQIYSQFGEDGIIEEIIKRVGSKTKYFVEIGTGDGMENNTVNLLVNGWKGLWLDADQNLCTLARQNLDPFITKGKLKIDQAFVDTDNVTKFFESANVPKEFDFLSIDIDGNDYWIWKKLSTYKPRIVCMEYNVTIGPTAEWIMKYNKSHISDSTNYFGASLKSFELLGRSLGYTLVGCSFAGTNVFFVRNDLTKNKFLTPSTSENFYEPARYFIFRKSLYPKSPKTFGDYIQQK